MPNRFVPLGPGSSFDEARAVLNANFGQLDLEAVTKVFNSPSGTPGFIQGKLPNDLGYGYLLYTPDGKVSIACYIDVDGNPILKIAKDGFDATTATNDELIFNSTQNVFKIVDTGTIPISHAHSANSALTTSQAHGQSGRPTIVCFANDLVAPGVGGSPSYQMPFLYPAVSGGNLVISTLLQAYTDGTNLTVYTWSANATTITANIKYYILQESAS